MQNNWKPFKVVTAGEFVNSQEQIEQYYRVVIQVPGFTTLEEFEGTLEECEKEATHLNQLISASLALHKVKPPKVKPVSPPSDDFIIVVDRDGDPLEVFSGNVNLTHVFETIDRLDRESGYHPHSAWRRSAGGFIRMFDRIEKEIGK